VLSIAKPADRVERVVQGCQSDTVAGSRHRRCGRPGLGAGIECLHDPGRAVRRDPTHRQRGMGTCERSCLAMVQLPLASPVLFAGIQTATVQNIGLATLAAFIGGGGLG
jgi:hypothetical protein